MPILEWFRMKFQELKEKTGCNLHPKRGKHTQKGIENVAEKQKAALKFANYSKNLFLCNVLSFFVKELVRYTYIEERF